MAVYTNIDTAALDQFLRGYDLGAVTSFKGIAEGVENSNFLLQTERGRFILTLFERRVRAADLPFFVGVMEHVGRSGFPVPVPVRDRNGDACKTLKQRPALIVNFLDGVSPSRPNEQQCHNCGAALARLHAALSDCQLQRRNNLSVREFPPMFAAHTDKARELDPELPRLIADDLELFGSSWPQHLPRGIIHADFFPDNALFLGNELSGAIDFYFACTDLLSYDLAICLNAWCIDDDGEPDRGLAASLIEGYWSVRRPDPEECELLPLLAHGAAMRFFLTRLADWEHRDERDQEVMAVLKDPLAFARRLSFHRKATGLADYGIAVSRMVPISGAKKPRPDLPMTVQIWTDGACKDNPGAGGWAVIIDADGQKDELSGGEKMSTNNRMELMAAIMALETLQDRHGRCQIILHTDSTYVKNGITSWIGSWKRNNWRNAAKKPVKNQDLWRRLDAARSGHEVRWRWVKAHAGNAGNERADLLARRASEQHAGLPRTS